MYGLIRTLPVSPPPGVGSVASQSGSAVWLAPRSFGSSSALTGVPEAFTSWKEPVSTGPLLLTAVSGVSVTVPTNEPAGIGSGVSTVSVTIRPVSSARIELSVIMLEAVLPLTPAEEPSVRAVAEEPEPPPTIPGTQSAGMSGLVEAQTGGRPMKALLPGPG